MTYTEVQTEVYKHYIGLKNLGYEVVGVFLYGSQNYGLEHENSDVDTKAIVLPSLDDIAMNRQPVSKTIEFESGQCDVKDIRKMFECFRKQNINFVELLFTKYYVLNEKYEYTYRRMLLNNELIARYNECSAVSCMAGMAMEKYAALDHPYPSIAHKIEKYGYDPKQLHHILRMKDIIERYCRGYEAYWELLRPLDLEHIKSIKIDPKYTLEEAKAIAKEAVDSIIDTKNNFRRTHESQVNKAAHGLMEEVLRDLIKAGIREEILSDN